VSNAGKCLLLGLLALLGYVAIAAGARPITNNATGRPDTNTIIPVLFDQQFNAFFGVAFAAIGTGAGCTVGRWSPGGWWAWATACICST
jgi:hypothetical protein